METVHPSRDGYVRIHARHSTSEITCGEAGTPPSYIVVRGAVSYSKGRESLFSIERGLSDGGAPRRYDHRGKREVNRYRYRSPRIHVRPEAYIFRCTTVPLGLTSRARLTGVTQAFVNGVLTFNPYTRLGTLRDLASFEGMKCCAISTHNKRADYYNHLVVWRGTSE